MSSDTRKSHISNFDTLHIYALNHTLSPSSPSCCHTSIKHWQKMRNFRQVWQLPASGVWLKKLYSHGPNHQTFYKRCRRTHYYTYQNWTLTIDTETIGSVTIKTMGDSTLFTFNRWQNLPWHNWPYWSFDGSHRQSSSVFIYLW